MNARYLVLAVSLTVLAAGAAQPAPALSMKDCSAKYQTAKQAGSTAKWNDFRKAECNADASPTATSTSAPAPATTTAATSRSQPASTGPTARRSAPASSAGFPTAIDPKYATESAGKGRMHTCLDSYKAAKANGTLGDAKWIQKGGGYYSACNAQLKG